MKLELLRIVASVTTLAGTVMSAGATTSRTTPIWVDERVRLGPAVRNSFLEELKTNRFARVTSVRFSSESAKPSGEVITITVRTTPPDRYPQALGLTWRSNGRILPRLEVYVSSLMRVFQGRVAPADLGRALARVVMHELLHYTKQRSEHDTGGIFNESLGPGALIAQSEALE